MAEPTNQMGTRRRCVRSVYLLRYQPLHLVVIGIILFSRKVNGVLSIGDASIHLLASYYDLTENGKSLKERQKMMGDGKTESKKSQKAQASRNSGYIRRKILASKKSIARIALVAILGVTLFMTCGCAALQSYFNDIKGSLVGNPYTIETYDNSGHLTMTTHGSKIDMEGNKVAEDGYDSDGHHTTNYSMSSVVTITIDGHEIETCGDTCIFSQDGLTKEVDFTNPETIRSMTNGSLTDNTVLAYELNKFKNAFGKSRIVVIKSQLGTPICAYSGDDVYYEVQEDLPKTTKLMIDGKALYIHRANFQIIDKALLD